MSRRAIGCLAAGGLVYLALGLFALWLATEPGREGCPAQLRWADQRYTAVATPAASPTIEGVDNPVALGSMLIGLSARPVYGAAQDVPTGESPRPPEAIALDCGDGSFQAYRAR